MDDNIFTGSYYYQIDPKGRMRIPAAFKSMLGGKLRIGFGTGKFLVIYTQESVQEMSANRKALDPIADREKSILYRNMFASMKDFDCDAQGRYTIPADMREMVDLVKDIVIVGFDSTVEIWSADNYALREDDDIAYWSVNEAARRAEEAKRKREAKASGQQ